MDNIFEVGKYLKKIQRKANYSLKRPNLPQSSVERIRDVFDPDNPMRGEINTPKTAKKVTLDFHFGKKLPLLGCCGDCLCGNTESFSGDQIISGSVYLSLGEYVPNSTVVYIDGVQATRNTDYIESSPTTGQITSLIPSPNLIVVSYVYNVGNCTESICIDERFECLDYTFVSGLTTVFSDRYDRSPESLPQCGRYYNTLSGATFTPSMFDGEASFGSNEAIYIGGEDVLVGKAVETLIAVNLDSWNVLNDLRVTYRSVDDDFFSNISHDVGFRFIMQSSTTMEIRLTPSVIIFNSEDDPFSDLNIVSIVSGSFANPMPTINVPITGGRYWFRMVQYPDGGMAAKIWPQFTPEPSAPQATFSLADTYSLIDPGDYPFEINRELAGGSVKSIQLFGPGFEAIVVGAGLDNGPWGANPPSLGPGQPSAVGYYCAALPQDYPDVRFGYNCSPPPYMGLSQVTYQNTGPTLHWGISYPTLFGPPAGDGTLGRIIDYTQGVVAIDTTNAHPGGLRIRGQLVGEIWENAVSVQINSYPVGGNNLTMGGINGIQGAHTLGTYLVPPDGTPVEVDLFVPVTMSDPYVRIGLHVPNLDLIATQQSFYFGGPTFSNNVGSDVRIDFFRVDGVENVQCTTGPFCNICDNTRCPTVVEGFINDTATRTSSPDFYRQPNQGLPVFYDANSRNQTIEFINGTQKVTANNNTAFLNIEFPSPFDCWYDGETNTYEASFDMRLTPPSSGTGKFGFGNLEVDVSSAGAISVFSFNTTTPTWPSVGTNITANAWYSIKYRIESDSTSVNLKLKSWLTGTAEPSSYNFEATTAMDQFLIYGGNATGFIYEIRNVNINKGVV